MPRSCILSRWFRSQDVVGSSSRQEMRSISATSPARSLPRSVQASRRRVQSVFLGSALSPASPQGPGAAAQWRRTVSPGPGSWAAGLGPQFGDRKGTEAIRQPPEGKMCRRFSARTNLQQPTPQVQTFCQDSASSFAPFGYVQERKRVRTIWALALRCYGMWLSLHRLEL